MTLLERLREQLKKKRVELFKWETFRQHDFKFRTERDLLQQYIEDLETAINSLNKKINAARNF